MRLSGAASRGRVLAEDACCSTSIVNYRGGEELTNGLPPRPASDLTADAIVSKNWALAVSYWEGVSSKKMPCIPSPGKVAFSDHFE
jgi:hypothetical protein